MVPRFALLIGTTIAAFLVRNLPASFNESTQLLSAMYNLVFFSILLPAIDAAVGRGTNTGVIAYSISVMLICLLTAAILFVPKFLLIAVGMKKPNGKSVDQNSKLSSSMSAETGSGSNRNGSSKSQPKQLTLTTTTLTGVTSIGKNAINTQPGTPHGTFGMSILNNPIGGRKNSASGPLPATARTSISHGKAEGQQQHQLRASAEAHAPLAVSPVNMVRRPVTSSEAMTSTPAVDATAEPGTIQLQFDAVTEPPSQQQTLHGATPPHTPSAIPTTPAMESEQVAYDAVPTGDVLAPPAE